MAESGRLADKPSGSTEEWSTLVPKLLDRKTQNFEIKKKLVRKSEWQENGIVEKKITIELECLQIDITAISDISSISDFTSIFEVFKETKFDETIEHRLNGHYSANNILPKLINMMKFPPLLTQKVFEVMSDEAVVNLITGLESISDDPMVKWVIKNLDESFDPKYWKKRLKQVRSKCYLFDHIEMPDDVGVKEFASQLMRRKNLARGRNTKQFQFETTPNPRKRMGQNYFGSKYVLNHDYGEPSRSYIFNIETEEVTKLGEYFEEEDSEAYHEERGEYFEGWDLQLYEPFILKTKKSGRPVDNMILQVFYIPDVCGKKQRPVTYNFYCDHRQYFVNRKYNVADNGNYFDQKQRLLPLINLKGFYEEPLYINDEEQAVCHHTVELKVLNLIASDEGVQIVECHNSILDETDLPQFPRVWFEDWSISLTHAAFKMHYFIDQDDPYEPPAYVVLISLKDCSVKKFYRNNIPEWSGQSVKTEFHEIHLVHDTVFATAVKERANRDEDVGRTLFRIDFEKEELVSILSWDDATDRFSFTPGVKKEPISRIIGDYLYLKSTNDVHRKIYLDKSITSQNVLSRTKKIYVIPDKGSRCMEVYENNSSNPLISTLRVYKDSNRLPIENALPNCLQDDQKGLVEMLSGAPDCQGFDFNQNHLIREVTRAVFDRKPIYNFSNQSR